MKGRIYIFLAVLTVFLLSCGGVVNYNQSINVEIEELPTEVSVFSEDFEAGHLYFWQDDVIPGASARISAGDGIDGTNGLKVALSNEESYIRNQDSARFEEGYLRFQFNPNSVDIPDDDAVSLLYEKSVEIARFQKTFIGETLVALMLRKTADGIYRAYLQWRSPSGYQYDYDGEFELTNNWQEITIGFKIDSWVAVWLNGELVRKVENVDHTYDCAYKIYLGQMNALTQINPQGDILFDNVEAIVPFRQDVWVDGNLGSDENLGASETDPVKTINRGLELASPGTVVHIQPGIYREGVKVVTGGTKKWPLTIRAEQGAGTVIVRGSVASKDIEWTQLTDNSVGFPHDVPYKVYMANLADYGFTRFPRFVLSLDSSGEAVERMPLAREPDWHVETEWKRHEYFWAADGGDMVEECTPEPGNGRCDCPDPDNSNYCPSRSRIMLTDVSDDDDPTDIEPGNLTTLGNIEGATLWVLDTQQAHNFFTRKIVEHDVENGQITLDANCSVRGNEPLGWGSKYYVENHPALLDNPGEWYYDELNQLLYVWPLEQNNPKTLSMEISKEYTGINLSHRSNVIVDGLNFEFFNDSAVRVGNGNTYLSKNITVKNSRMRYCNYGAFLWQHHDGEQIFDIDGFKLLNSEIAYMDSKGFSSGYNWGENSTASEFETPGITNITIKDNDFHDMGFRPDSDFPVGLSISWADHVVFERNRVSRTAHCGLNFWAAVDSDGPLREFSPEEIKTGDILVKDNIFEKACQLNADCGAVKIGGSPVTNDWQHVFRDFLVIGNVFRDTIGWTYVTEKRGGRWSGEGSDVKGMGGFGFYVDYASGIHAYRNISYNNPYISYAMYGYWRHGEMVYYNNIAANSVYGFHMSSNIHAADQAVDLQIVNNILINNEAYGVFLSDQDGLYENMLFDYNLYFNNGWRSEDDGGLIGAGNMRLYVDWPGELLYTLEDIQNATPWEDNGLETDPMFTDYDLEDHDYFDGSWADFAVLSEESEVVDSGSELPASLNNLLFKFNIDNPQGGSAWDLGYFEYGTETPDRITGKTMVTGCSTISGKAKTNMTLFNIILGLILILAIERKRFS